MTNEQKLDEIYAIVKAEERRRRRDSLGRILKWVIILGIAGFILSNPGYVIKKITDIVQPIVMDQVKTMMEENKDNLMESVKDLLPTP